MRKYVIGVIAMVLLVVGAAGLAGTAEIAVGSKAVGDDLQPMTVRGEVSDSMCAAAGSHGKMMEKNHAKDATECTLACVKGGAEFVLYNTDDKTTYRLDSKDPLQPYAGQTVTVIGQYDRATSTLHVDRIETQ